MPAHHMQQILKIDQVSKATKKATFSNFLKLQNIYYGNNTKLVQQKRDSTISF